MAARMSREESKALTREKLIASARNVFARLGMAGASIDRIAEEAGFSKGAFYSNFESKEEIFFELLDEVAKEDSRALAQALESVSDPESAIKAICDWARAKTRDPNVPLLLLELARKARSDEAVGKRHRQLFHEQWIAVGKLAMRILPEGSERITPLMLGGLILELTYSNATLLHDSPTSSDLIAAALHGLRDGALWHATQTDSQDE
ncbi:TetR/AcrR family transcriptional regulator [Cupriavidus campinensis]|uniref:TetR/AcrR family transcriptional regulator n=1 Tax=Cupriavidus campinensis TaxID=151783 RepID=A0ABY3ETF6_9BURK|nr:TetR/AcrR family transcriptional regulator [Cupriavidus campinensis]TSP14263.1 TetR/AcrR family transcriptional regulator [Cupriavidus campinensis]